MVNIKRICTYLHKERKDYGKKTHWIVHDDDIRGRVRRSYGNIFNLTLGSFFCTAWIFTRSTYYFWSSKHGLKKKTGTCNPQRPRCSYPTRTQFQCSPHWTLGLLRMRFVKSSSWIMAVLQVPRWGASWSSSSRLDEKAQPEYRSRVAHPIQDGVGKHTAEPGGTAAHLKKKCPPHVEGQPMMGTAEIR